MGSFEVWRRHALAAKQHRVCYVAGTDSFLRAVVVSGERAGMPEHQVVPVWADGSNDGAIFDELYQAPLTGSKLVVVRDAHLIRNWSRFPDWLKNIKDTRVCFSGDGTDFDVRVSKSDRFCSRGHPLTAGSGIIWGRSKKFGDCAACHAVKGLFRGTQTRILVRCNRPDTEVQRRDATNFLAEQFGTPRIGAERLLEATGWDVGGAIAVLQKLGLLGLPLSAANITGFTKGLGESDFEKALRRGDRAKAASYAADVPTGDVPRMFGRLDRWLGLVAITHPMVRLGLDAHALGRRTDAGYTECLALQREAGKYDKSRLDRAVLALGDAWAAWSKGYRIGVLEELAFRW